MVDVFISYAHDDRDTAKQIADILEERGLSVWWDSWIQPRAGKTFHSLIDKRLQACRCILVLWSRASVESRWVLDEADVGIERGIFVHAIIDDVKPPLGFRRFQFASLRGWSGNPKEGDFPALLQAIEHFVRRRESS